jgi:hypothetical protein
MINLNNFYEIAILLQLRVNLMNYSHYFYLLIKLYVIISIYN